MGGIMTHMIATKSDAHILVQQVCSYQINSLCDFCNVTFDILFESVFRVAVVILRRLKDDKPSHTITILHK